MVEFNTVKERNEVKIASKMLKGMEELNHVYIKADMAKAERTELTRLYKVKEKLEAEEDEESNRKFEVKHGKLYVDEQIIDRVNTDKTYFL